MPRWPKTEEQRALDAMVGKRIERERQKLGMTASRLAREAGITQGQVYWIESGRTTLSLTTGIKIAGALGVSLALLVPNCRSCGFPDEDDCAASEA